MGSGNKYYAIKTKFDKTDTTPAKSGIYLGTRVDKDITYFYVGQAMDLHERKWEYYQIIVGLRYPTRHFEASLKKHKDGTFAILEFCEVVDLDDREQSGIKHYMAQPNYVTRNETFTGLENTVKSNSKRLERIDKKWENKISNCIHNVNTSLDSSGLHLSPKMTKKGVPTKLSMRYFNELLELLKVGK